MLDSERAKELQKLSAKARSKNVKARDAFNDALTKEPELIARLIGSNSEQLASTKLGGEWLLNSAQSILVSSILEAQKQAFRLELEQLKAELKSDDVLEIRNKPDVNDIKRVWHFDEITTPSVMKSVDSRLLLELFAQNKSEEPPIDAQNRLLSIWRLHNEV
ncbi:hypothetical protein AB4182_03985 [Vibrio splendidus]